MCVYDVIIIAEKKADPQTSLAGRSEILKHNGMKINKLKTKAMAADEDQSELKMQLEGEGGGWKMYTTLNV